MSGRARRAVGALVVGVVTPLGLLAVPAAHADTPSTTYATGFESGTDGWYGRGSAQVATSTAAEHTGADSLLVTGRTASWNGPALDLSSRLTAGATYSIDAWVRLAPGAGSETATLTVDRAPVGGSEAYDTVAYRVPASDSGWTELKGSYSFATANTKLELYVETPDTASLYLDDVTITETAPPPPTDPNGPSRQDLSSDFESGLQGWGPRGDAHVATTTDAAHGGSTSLLTTNRLQSWQGPTVDVTQGLAVGQTVQVSVWAKLTTGSAPAALKVSIQRDKAGQPTSYDNVAGAAATVTADTWTQLRGSYTLGAAIDTAQLYVEGDAGASFLIDDFSLTGVTETPIQDVPALKDVLGAQGFEHVGTAIDQRETVGRPSQLFLKHFNSFTPENDAKPESTEPTEGTFTFGNLDHLLDFADAHHVQVYGHVLFWHSQTPDWMFEDSDGRPLTNSAADQAILLAHMEEHVKGIADHLEARYPNGNSPIWAWDVANETINDSPDGNPFDMRDSRYYQILGQQWVADGFRIADEYFPDQKLFINDYNTEMPTKRVDYLGLIGSLIAQGVPIDGVGNQAHVDFGRPVQWLDDTLTAVERLSASTGHPLIQGIQELDVSDSAQPPAADVGGSGNPTRATPDDTAAGIEVGYYYRDLFQVLRKHSGSLQTLTFWDLDNARSWLRTWPTARPWEQPLPFDDDLQVTPAYWGIVDPSQLPTPRPDDFIPPRIAGHLDVVATATSTTGAVVTYTPPSTIDTRDGVLAPHCTAPSGSTFPVGTSTVTCTATDAAGNKADPVTFAVTVTPLYQRIDNGAVVSADVHQVVQLVVQFGNTGGGVLSSPFSYACTPTNTFAKDYAAVSLALAPGSARQVGARSYPLGQNATFTVRGTPTGVGTAVESCVMTMTDGAGKTVTSAPATVTIVVRR